MTPKENYRRMLLGEIPDYMPSFFEPHSAHIAEELLTPVFAPDGPIVTSLGVTYVGSPENNFGAMPAPGKVLLEDVTKWRDVVKLPDLTGRDWEGYYTRQVEKLDRENLAVTVTGGDYFLTLVSLMGFENALIAMYEEPEEVEALLDFISGFYLEVMKQELRWAKPELFNLMDDDAAYRAPFFSLDIYRRLFKPLHKKHCDLALNAGMLIERHDCGRSEQFIPDWIELGVKSWTPAQTTNDLPAIKKNYVGKLALAGCWDNQGPLGDPRVPEETLREALYTYVDSFAPGGGFTFMAMVSGKGPETEAKMSLIKEFYYSYARDWYKHH